MKKQTVNTIVKSVIWISIFSIMLYMCVGQEEPLTPEQVATESIEKNFNGWDGSHIKLTRFVKENLNDPDSYEHIETTYKVTGDSIWLFMNYRAKNSFGGIVKEGITAIANKETGELIQVIPQQ
jgi:hypothetical protein